MQNDKIFNYNILRVPLLGGSENHVNLSEYLPSFLKKFTMEEICQFLKHGDFFLLEGPANHLFMTFFRAIVARAGQLA